MYERRRGGQASSRTRHALALGACALTAITGCASAAAYNPANLAPGQLSQVDAICHSVMGLSNPYDVQGAACVESLSESFGARLRADRMLEIRQDCRARGLKPGTAALSACEMAPGARKAALSQRPAPVAALPAAPAKSYFSASFDQVRRREQRACADIGYDPMAGGFNQCVADLAANLNHADFPPN